MQQGRFVNTGFQHAQSILTWNYISVRSAGGTDRLRADRKSNSLTFCWVSSDGRFMTFHFFNMTWMQHLWGEWRKLFPQCHLIYSHPCGAESEKIKVKKDDSQIKLTSCISSPLPRCHMTLRWILTRKTRSVQVGVWLNKHLTRDRRSQLDMRVHVMMRRLLDEELHQSEWRRSWQCFQESSFRIWVIVIHVKLD